MFGHDKRSLGQLLNTPVEGKDASYFQVPKYQRKYEWEKEREVSKLIEDIFDNLGQTYFMGPLILCPTISANGSSIELIDGQQRLATLAIFIRALVDYIQSRKTEASFPTGLVEQMNNIQYELKNKILKGGLIKNDVVIHLGRKINQFFRDNILMSDEKDKVAKLKVMKKGEHPSILRLIDAYFKVWDTLLEKYDETNGESLVLELHKLASSLLNEKQFLVVTVQNKSDAYTVFETINARGRPLTLSDLVKNMFFEKLEPDLGVDRIDDFESDWDEAELAVSDFASFMWHAWVSRFHTCPKNKVFDRLQHVVRDMSMDKTFDFATELILDESKYYHNYENPADESVEDKRQYLEMLRAMDATRCYPLLLSVDWAYAKEYMTKNDIINLFRIITCLTFWYSGICGKDAKKLESTYHILAREIREKSALTSGQIFDEVANELYKAFPTLAECKASFTTRAFTDTSFIKMVLGNIENVEFKKVETTLKSPAKVQLEHILPRNPDPSWKSVFPDEKEMKEYTYRLGNLTLLFARLNEAAKNAPFLEKKKHYEKSEVVLTKSLADIPEWNANEIEKRTQKLFQLSQKIWPIYTT